MGRKELARELRKNMTEAERLLWQELRNRKLMGKKFLRQHPVVYQEIMGKKDFFILDFYCAEHRLCIELDGGIHDTQKAYDAHRDSILAELGIKVVRFKNKATKNMELLLEQIAGYLNSPPAPL